MKPSKRNLALSLGVLFIALLALPVLSRISVRTTQAGTQELGKHDNKPDNKVKQPRQRTQQVVINGAAPANDNCANAIAVTCPTFTHTVDTGGATDEVGEPASTCTDQGNSVWYTFTNGSNPTQLTVSTCSSAPMDTAVMVWRADGGPCDFANFTAIECNDDADCGDGFQSLVTFLADPGATYKIQAGGFDSETGTMTVDISCIEFECPLITVNGTLGSGSPDWPFTTGVQTPARLFRDGIGSTCAAPKACPGPFGSGAFNFDAYTFTNESDDPQCVQVNFDPNTGATPAGVNVHAIAYLGTYSPTALCTNYLGDVGSSDTLPFSFTVPAGANFVVVIAANNPGGIGVGQTYAFSILANICQGFDTCVQQDGIPGRFIQFNSTTGSYRFEDCGKGLVLEGTGVVTQTFCKIRLLDMGPVPKNPDRLIDLLVNPCTLRGDAKIRTTKNGPLTTILDTNINNNTCACP